ncbi:hypothetical protein OG547_35420 (plasmid) [Streptomyces longwoodensis]|uniref:hypothetical protein n=1 Tax=Streptomyces longwoodensis TaxID=68231 RepID=UPI002ED3572D|nr:hypothetical protein OG547_35420 [Streptomyces longwoodensis]
MSNNNPQDRHTIALAVMGAVLAGLIALAHPALIPALTIAFAAFMALTVFLKL